MVVIMPKQRKEAYELVESMLKEEKLDKQLKQALLNVVPELKTITKKITDFFTATPAEKLLTAHIKTTRVEINAQELSDDQILSIHNILEDKINNLTKLPDDKNKQQLVKYKEKFKVIQNIINDLKKVDLKMLLKAEANHYNREAAKLANTDIEQYKLKQDKASACIRYLNYLEKPTPNTDTAEKREKALLAAHPDAFKKWGLQLEAKTHSHLYQVIQQVELLLQQPSAEQQAQSNFGLRSKSTTNKSRFKL